jgi:hypothetical protein
MVDIEGILEEVVVKVMGHASRKTRFCSFQWTGIVEPPRFQRSRYIFNTTLKKNRQIRSTLYSEETLGSIKLLSLNLCSKFKS